MDSDTIQVLGMDLQRLWNLGEGYYLVAHPNGPAIATTHSLHTLGAGISELPELNDGPPLAVVQRAVDVYVWLSWPATKVNLIQ